MLLFATSAGATSVTAAGKQSGYLRVFTEHWSHVLPLYSGAHTQAALPEAHVPWAEHEQDGVSTNPDPPGGGGGGGGDGNGNGDGSGTLVPGDEAGSGVESPFSVGAGCGSGSKGGVGAGAGGCAGVLSHWVFLGLSV